MKKWSEIKQATLDKLFLDDSEAEQQGYLAKFGYLANEGLVLIANGVKPKIGLFEHEALEDNTIVKMPDDFISFTNMVNYLNDSPDPTIVYMGDKSLKLPIKGNYKIYYNAAWQKITKKEIDENSELEIDDSILTCLPTYIASQLLAQDDIQRSTILKNEFELMLSRLDTDIFYQENHFKSTGGWY